MRNDIDMAEFFNQLSSSTFEAMAGKSAEGIFWKLKSLELSYEEVENGYYQIFERL